MRTWVGLSALIAGASLALAQQYVISTIAGGGPPATAKATDISIQPGSVASLANVYFSAGFRVWKLLPNGTITVIAGNGTEGYSGDGGRAAGARLSYVNGLAEDSEGNLYISDFRNARVRKVSPSGIITTVAGTGVHGYSGDGGPATSAQLDSVTSVAVSGLGNLYIADGFRIRRVLPNGIITTIAGTGTPGYSGDGGPATSAQLSLPLGVATDGEILYIADYLRVRRISPSGTITTVAGNGTAGHSGDGGPATAAQTFASGVAVDVASNLYILDGYCDLGCEPARVRKVSIDGIITTVAGNGTEGYSGDGGPAIGAQLSNSTSGLAADGDGNLYIADFGNLRVRKVSANGIITTAAGNGFFSYSGDGGPAASAQLGGTRDVAVDRAGNVYLADQDNHVIRKISPQGIITTIAGNRTAAYSGDGGPAARASLCYPTGVAADRAGNLYIADMGNYRVRKVSSGGTITTIAGTGVCNPHQSDLPGYSGDGGPATSAKLDALDVAADSAGNVYIADSRNSRIRKVSPDGIITTVAGNGTLGFSGDGGPATSAQIGAPYGVAVDVAGNLYIADSGHVRKVSLDGIITTAAGNWAATSLGDGGPATSAQVGFATGVALDGAGNLYMADADYLHSRIRKVSPAGIITTIAGTGTPGYSGDGGPATSAQLSLPIGMAVDAAGNVYIADGFVVRLLEPDGPAPVISAITNAASNLAGSVAAGEIVVLHHSGIGPAQQAQFHLNDAGLVDTQLDRTQVTFNGTPAPLVYTWTSSLSAIVPYSVSGTSAQVRLTFRGQTSAPFTVPVASSSPGLFTINSTGQGQAVAMYFDGGYNSVENPAEIGRLITLFATGEGQTSPPGVDGKLAGALPPRPLLPVSVTIGGQPAPTSCNYCGSPEGVPGMVAGVMQVGVLIPSGITPGNAVPVIVQVGNASSQSGVMIAVSGN